MNQKYSDFLNSFSFVNLFVCFFVCSRSSACFTRVGVESEAQEPEDPEQQEDFEYSLLMDKYSNILLYAN